MRLSYLAILFLVFTSALSFAGDDRRVLVIAGMQSEAKLVEGDAHVLVVLSGGDPVALREKLAALEPGSIKSVLSFGVAGGLNPGVKVGEVLLTDDVQSDDAHHFATDGRLTANLVAGIQGKNLPFHRGPLLGSAAAHLTAADKSALHRRTGADGVDMESQEGAAYAVAHGLPFTVLRVVSDPADFDLPPVILEAINPDGSINYGVIMKAIASDPSLAGALWTASGYFKAAQKNLQAARAAIDFGSL
jgi:hopanoid-associated phosphorylase